MKGKYIALTIGISSALAGLGIFIYKHKGKIKDEAENALEKAAELLKGWMHPVSTTKISSGFGYRTNPVTKKSQFHNGIDLPVPAGTTIKSPYDGVAEKVYSNKEGGNQLIIKHSNGFRTGYAHLTKSLVKAGDKIKKGDAVALSGNTGAYTTGAHLHFTLKDSLGNMLDPKMLYA